MNEYLDGRLARYKRLDGGVRFVCSIPKTTSGKILKRLLREKAKREPRYASNVVRPYDQIRIAETSYATFTDDDGVA